MPSDTAEERLQRNHAEKARERAMNRLRGRSHGQKVADHIGTHPSVREVEWAEGEDHRQYWVTFDQRHVPYRFHELYGFDSESAWVTMDKYRLRDYVSPTPRIRALYRLEDDDS